jgi:hypothetical protein
MYTRHRRVSMESEVAAAEKAAAQARKDAEEAAALIQDEVHREVGTAFLRSCLMALLFVCFLHQLL